MVEEKKSASEKLKLVKVETKGVLGEYDHKIEFSNSEPFVIVYGPNGVGKTKFLEIIYAASSINVAMLTELPFAEVKLTYHEGTVFSISKGIFEKNDKSSGLKLTLVDGITQISEYDEIEYSREIARWEERHPYMERIEPDIWQDVRDGEIITFEELVRAYPKIRAYKKDLKESFLDFKNRVSSFLIEAQRLQSDPMRSTWGESKNSPSGRRLAGIKRKTPQRRTRSKITDLSNHMRELIIDAETKHSRVTQQLDKTFPNRFLNQTAERTGQKNIDPEEVKKRYNVLNEARKQIANMVSLDLAGNELPLPVGADYENFQLQLLNLYLDDMEEKYSPFVPLLEKISIFEEILNSRLLNKTIRITGEEGIVVNKTKENIDDIDLENLSSGEKHEIILMYDLLFNVPRGSIVLIDEPEISLHVAWQFKFIPDVKRIAKVADFQFIIATHSPQIINDDRASSVRLGPSNALF